VAAQAAELAQGVEALASAGENLVHVRLVPGVEDDPVARTVEDPVQGDAELDHAEVDAEVTAGARHGVDEEVPDLGAEPLDVGVPEAAKVVGTRDFLEDHRASVATARRWGPRPISAERG